MIDYQQYGGIAYLTLANKAAGNVLNTTMLTQLNQALQEANQDEQCRVIVLSAQGSNFCNGLDLQSVSTEIGGVNPLTMTLYTDTLSAICQSSRPVITCLEGNVTAGGLGLVAASDVVITLNTVQFTLSEVIVGLIPALVTPFLLRRLSLARIQAWTISTRTLSAEEAHHWGLVDEIVSAPMQSALTRQLKRLLRSSPQAITKSKQYFNALNQQNITDQLTLAQQNLTDWLAQPDVITGIKEFADGLAPPWFQKYRRRPDV